jgi:hypothetical protein
MEQTNRLNRNVVVDRDVDDDDDGGGGGDDDDKK